MDFNSHTDGVVADAVALVNALTEGERRGRPYVPDDRVAAATGALKWSTPTPAEADALAEAARELRAVFESFAAGDVDGAADQVNRLLERYNARPHLARHDGEPWHVHFHASGDALAAQVAAPCATGLAVVIDSGHHDRLGVCTAPHCDRVYVDVSRNGTRRFCSTACQNRVKTAAFRARAAGS